MRNTSKAAGIARRNAKIKSPIHIAPITKVKVDGKDFITPAGKQMYWRGAEEYFVPHYPSRSSLNRSKYNGKGERIA